MVNISYGKEIVMSNLNSFSILGNNFTNLVLKKGFHLAKEINAGGRKKDEQLILHVLILHSAHIKKDISYGFIYAIRYVAIT